MLWLLIGFYQMCNNYNLKMTARSQFDLLG